MLGLQPQSQQTRCIFHLYPNGRASYHDLRRARSHAGKSTRLNAPPLHASETYRGQKRKVGDAASWKMRVCITHRPGRERGYPSYGETASAFPKKQRHQPFVFGHNRTRRAKRRRPRPPPTPASPPPAHAPSERSEQWRPTPPHPPACAASPKTQGSPRLSPERFRRRGRRPRNRRRRFPDGGYAPRTSEGESRGLPGWSQRLS